MLNLKIVNQQLPVGVFLEEIRKKNTLFKSAIDIWGLKDSVFSIFELKYKNSKIGIVSELLFYIWLMNYVFLEKKNKIKYPIQASKSSYRNFNFLFNNKDNINEIKGYFLIDILHPLIDDKCLDLINTGLKNIGNISVERLYYKYDKDKNIII